MAAVSASPRPPLVDYNREPVFDSLKVTTVNEYNGIWAYFKGYSVNFIVV